MAPKVQESDYGNDNSFKAFLYASKQFKKIRGPAGKKDAGMLHCRRIGYAAQKAIASVASVGIAAFVQYFLIPKKDGSFRTIEDPAAELKKVQKTLNSYLQAVYYFVKSQAAYGFAINLENDVDDRNILTNAQKHCGVRYLLNVDMEDFFHAVSRQSIIDLLNTPIFRFNEEAGTLITGLTALQEWVLSRRPRIIVLPVGMIFHIAGKV